MRRAGKCPELSCTCVLVVHIGEVLERLACSRRTCKGSRPESYMLKLGSALLECWLDQLDIWMYPETLYGRMYDTYGTKLHSSPGDKTVATEGRMACSLVVRVILHDLL